LNEVIKLAVCLSVALYDISRSLPPSTPATTLFTALSNSVFATDSWKLAIPATLYTLQNSLQYIAVSNLDAATFQVTYQLKILSTALFSVAMLGRSLSLRKWAALVLLTLGVAIVQMPSSDPSLEPLRDAQSKFYFPRSLHELGQISNEAMEVANELTKRALSKRSATYEGIQEDIRLSQTNMNSSVGLMAVAAACIVSSLAGVYFEKVLKESSDSVTLWVRNVQLSFYSLFPAFFFGIIIKDGGGISKYGFFNGYNSVVWTVIVFQALGGVVVSLVVNYADNIAKNFATSISIILSFVASVYFFNFQVTASVCNPSLSNLEVGRGIGLMANIPV
jgi:UDP-sugar transporter A1/2/3